MEANILKTHNIKNTKPRLKVLELLVNSNESLSVEGLSKLLSDIDISTIYRTLNLFEEKKIVVKVFDEKHNHFVYKYLKHQHYHHLNCINCHTTLVTEFCPMDTFIENEILDKKFHITNYVFEIYGYCDKCYKELNL